MENLIKLKCFRDSLNENELRLLHSLEHGQWIPISKLGVLLTRHGIYKKKSDTKLSDVFKEDLSTFYDFENRIENGYLQPYIRMKQPKRIDASFYGQGSNSRVSTSYIRICFSLKQSFSYFLICLIITLKQYLLQY